MNQLGQKHKNIVVGVLLVVLGIALGLGYSAKYGPPVKLSAMFSSASNIGGGEIPRQCVKVVNAANRILMQSGSMPYEEWFLLWEPAWQAAADCLESYPLAS